MLRDRREVLKDLAVYAAHHLASLPTESALLVAKVLYSVPGASDTEGAGHFGSMALSAPTSLGFLELALISHILAQIKTVEDGKFFAECFWAEYCRLLGMEPEDEQQVQR